MNKRDFQKLKNRDETCVATGQETDRLIPNHRIDRGMGGSKLLDNPENLVLMDSIINGLITHDKDWERKAFKYGWSLESWQDPATEPFYHIGLHQWVQPDGDWNLLPARIPARLINV